MVIELVANCRILPWDKPCRFVVGAENAYVGHLLNEQKTVVSRVLSIYAEGRVEGPNICPFCLFSAGKREGK